MDKIRAALDAAHYYRSLGLTPLPSRMDSKRPTLEYACYRDTQVDLDVYSPEHWRTTNIQLMTGANHRGRTKIVVVDLDGPAATDAWKRLLASHGAKYGRSWITETGSGGFHIYYAMPPGVATVKTRIVWALVDPTGGKDGNAGLVKHSEIRLIGDSGLVVAPPSVHTNTGKTYRWKGMWNPEVFPVLDPAPDWLIHLPRLQLGEMFAPGPEIDWGQAARPLHMSGWRQTVDAIPARDKIRLAQEWGVRFVGPTSASHKILKCRAIGREDKNPSASFNVARGVLTDYATDTHYSFPELAVQLGVFGSFKEAMDWIDRTYGNIRERSS